MNAQTKKLCYDFNPCDPGKSRSDLEECIKGIKKALSLKLPTEEKDGVAKFTCTVAGCKNYPYRENLRRHIRLQHEAPPKAAKRMADSSADKGRSA